MYPLVKERAIFHHYLVPEIHNNKNLQQCLLKLTAPQRVTK